MTSWTLWTVAPMPTSSVSLQILGKWSWPASDYEVKKTAWEGLLRGRVVGRGSRDTQTGLTLRGLSLCPLQTLYWFAITISVSHSYNNRKWVSRGREGWWSQGQRTGAWGSQAETWPQTSRASLKLTKNRLNAYFWLKLYLSLFHHIVLPRF